MTESPAADSGFNQSISIMDMDNTTQVANNEMEFQVVSPRVHCSFFGDPLTMFLIGGIGMSLVSLMGIVGNILCAIVLSRPSMRTSTNIILLGLSVCDFVFVFMALLIFGIPWSIEYFCVDSFESLYFTTLYPIIVTYFVPLISIAQLGSTYFTVCVTMERFFVVYRPLMARPYCTNKNAVRASLVIAAFTIVFTMPTWWEFGIESLYDEGGEWTHYRLLPSLRKNVDYVLYYRTWVSMFVYRIIPMTLLTLLNISIYWKIRKANKMRESMTQVNSSEISLAKMLLWIVSIFLLCNLSQVYVNVREAVASPADSPELITGSLFLFNLNSAVNFIIYCLMAKKFRLLFLDLFCPNKLRGRSGSGPRNGGAGRATPNTQHSATNSTSKV